MPNSLQQKIQRHEKIIGLISSTLATVMFLSLVEVLLSNLRGDSNIYIQPLATALSGFFWAMYGYGKKDLFLIIPNTLALIIGILTAISAFV